MEDLFDNLRDMEELGRRLPGRTPVDIREEADIVEVVVDLPGVEKDQIDVTSTPTTLTINAADDTAVEHEEKTFYRRERRSRRYQRTLTLPARVDPDTAEATYENGVLTVRLDKTEGDRTPIDVN